MSEWKRVGTDEAALRKRIAELEAEQTGIRELCARLAENRLQRDDGYTIIDFLRLWHDQQKARAEAAEALLEEITEWVAAHAGGEFEYTRTKYMTGALQAILAKRKEEGK